MKNIILGSVVFLAAAMLTGCSWQQGKSVQAPTPAQPIVFNSCDSLSTFATQTWYPAFITLVKKDFQERTISDDTFDDVGSYAKACVALQGGLVLATFPGGYCKQGRVFKYTIPTNTLEPALLVNNIAGGSCYVAPDEFVKQNSNVYELSRVMGDAGEEATLYFDYDIIRNMVTMRDDTSR